MNDPILKKSIEAKNTCYFISPHLDDAILSAGGLIAMLAQYTTVKIISVFTESSPPPYSLSTKTFLRQCNYDTAEQLFQQRKNEDMEACAKVGITPLHLGYQDALWRKISRPNIVQRALGRVIPELLQVYPTYRFHITREKISNHDIPLMEHLGKRLREITANDNEPVIFCPLALHTHIDHIIVRDVCLKHFKNVFLWADFPYHTEHPISIKEIGTLATETFRFEEMQKEKLEMIKSYTSQIKAMFHDGKIPMVPEVFYTPSIKKQPQSI